MRKILLGLGLLACTTMASASPWWKVTYSTTVHKAYAELSGNFTMYKDTTTGTAFFEVIDSSIMVTGIMGPKDTDNSTIAGGFSYSSDDGLMLSVDSTSSGANRNIIITDVANKNKDHDHSALSNDPIIFVHSVQDPDVDNTQWLSLSHNGSNARINSGKGGVLFESHISAQGEGLLLGDTVGHDLVVAPTYKAMILTSFPNYSKNHDHSGEVDPTFYIQSSQDPDVDNTQWFSMSYSSANDQVEFETGGNDFVFGGDVYTDQGFLVSTDSTTLVAGDLLRWNGTDFVRIASGTVSNTYLRNDFLWSPAGAGAASTLQIQVDGVEVSSPTASVDFTNFFLVDENPGAEANVNISTAALVVYVAGLVEDQSFTGQNTFTGGVTLDDSIEIDWNDNSYILGDTTNYALVLVSTNNKVLVTSYANKDANHEWSSETDPAIRIYSHQDVIVDSTQWMEITYSSANDRGEITLGTPRLYIDAEVKTSMGQWFYNGYGITFYNTDTGIGGPRLHFDKSHDDSLHLVLGSATDNNAFIISETYYKNFDHGDQTSPTVFIHSEQDPDVDNTQWFSMCYSSAGDRAEFNTGGSSYTFQTGILHVGSTGTGSYASGEGDIFAEGIVEVSSSIYVGVNDYVYLGGTDVYLHDNSGILTLNSDNAGILLTGTSLLLQDNGSSANSIRFQTVSSSPTININGGYPLRFVDDYVRIGDAGTAVQASGDGDLYVEDVGEIEKLYTKNLYLTNSIKNVVMYEQNASGHLKANDGYPITFGNASDFYVGYEHPYDSLNIGYGSDVTTNKMISIYQGEIDFSTKTVIIDDMILARGTDEDFIEGFYSDKDIFKFARGTTLATGTTIYAISNSSWVAIGDPAGAINADSQGDFYVQYDGEFGTRVIASTFSFTGSSDNTIDVQMYYDDETAFEIDISTSIDVDGYIKMDGNKIINPEDYAISITTPNALGTVAILVSPFRSFACTISSITARCIGGTNVTFMLEQRSISGSNAAGTDIWSGDVAAVPGSWIGGTSSDFTMQADYGLFLVPTSVSGDVDRLMIRYGITRD